MRILQPLFIKTPFSPTIDISFKKTTVLKLNISKTIDAYLIACLINIKSNTLSSKIKLYKRFQDKNVTIDFEKNFSIDDKLSNLFLRFLYASAAPPAAKSPNPPIGA